MPGLQLGKLPATDDPNDLLFKNYVDASKIPAPPEKFGNESLFPPKGWGMLGNDEWGDCVWAGAGHETMLLSKLGGGAAEFTPQDVLTGYEAVTHFNPQAGPPGNNPTDKGTDTRLAYKYRRATGILDEAGTTHKIGAYVKLEQGNMEHLYQAVYLFDVVGIGFLFPEYAMTQFNEGKPWTVIPGQEPKPEEGHYVPCIGKQANLEVVTWGALQQMTVAFFEAYCDEAWTYISEEVLVNGLDKQGFDLDQLKADLAGLKGQAGGGQSS
jgi:hypothetical protein